MAITGKEIYNNTVAFANSAVINTQKTITVPMQGIIAERYLVSVLNPSLVSDVTVKFFTDGAFVDVIIIPKQYTITGTVIGGMSFLIEGILVNSNMFIVISNNTALGGTDAFNATLIIKEAGEN